MNLSTTRPGKLDTLDATIVAMMKRDNEVMYGMLRPIRGTSDSGLKNRGPVP